MMKRTPLKRKTGLRRQSRTSQAALRREMDKLWSQYIHLKFRERCVVDSPECRGPLNAHHLISRSVLHLRGNEMNGVLLCALHHIFSKRMSAHGAGVIFGQWLRLFMSEYDKWIALNKNTCAKPDYAAAIVRLKQLLQEAK
jgi:hypothetical protein